MTEYELHTQGAKPLPSEVRRFTDGRDYQGSVGMPAVVESPTGEYVLFADYELLRIENEIWRNRTIKAEEKNANTTT